MNEIAIRVAARYRAVLEERRARVASAECLADQNTDPSGARFQDPPVKPTDR